MAGERAGPCGGGASEFLFSAFAHAFFDFAAALVAWFFVNLRAFVVFLNSGVAANASEASESAFYRFAFMNFYSRQLLHTLSKFQFFTYGADED